MAVMVPAEINPSTLSKWERTLFGHFRNDISDDYYVLHSLGVTNHSRKLWAEADYVIISPKGIFVLEVKGGGIEFKDGIWTYIEHNGKRHDNHEGPFQQAKDVMYAIKKKIEDDDRNRGFIFGYGVIMPDETFTCSSPEIDLNVLLSKHNWDSRLKGYISELEEYWIEKNLNSVRCDQPVLDKNKREILLNVLRPNIKTTYTLKSRMNNLEDRLVELTDEQYQILVNMDENPRTIIVGGTGTGKTILALQKAKSLAADGRKVLFLCFNLLLADSLKENIESGKGITVDAIHSYMRSVIDIHGQGDRLKTHGYDESTLFNRVYPEVYCDVLLNSPDFEPFDALVIDEAQDLLTENNLEALDLTIKGGLRDGVWHFFLDPNQDIFSNFSSDDKKSLQKKYHPAVCKLTRNCRNTKEIVDITAEISSIAAQSECACEGGTTKIVLYQNENDFKKKLEVEVKALLDGGLTPKDFIILSTKKKENSVVSGLDKIAGYEVKDIREKPRRPVGKLVAMDINSIREDCKSVIQNSEAQNFISFCTMHAFKGLERKAVLAVDIEQPSDTARRCLLYSGLSRAKCYLVVFAERGKL